ncbi:MBL fold metallo-hydrolase [Kordiimonas lipolytica]|uniref:MBL fold metallo-hydrolase n=1 Tax=Kordiimonas lipolytica TaxID=1662421 RepID=A0ABV8U9C2_9PROT|nr:MBL fold metallo-hydrolase [Kordiimonas lipolytica]
MKDTFAALILSALTASSGVYAQADIESFCADLPRPAYSALEKRPESTGWFELYTVAPGVTAIYEPFQWQEVISYLIEGENRAILFDTGNGIEDIKAVVDRLTDKPVTVINSHSHYDHVGGNHQFGRILSVSTDFSREMEHGLPNEAVHEELSGPALCKSPPSGATAETHAIKPYSITGTVKEGDVIDLGGRKLEILQLPGHTSDAIALLERETGYLWIGDTYYNGPIWLFAPQTDLKAYRASIARLVALAPTLTKLFPAHNTAVEDPSELARVQAAFEKVVTTDLAPDAVEDGMAEFRFDGFSFIMRPDNRHIGDE